MTNLNRSSVNWKQAFSEAALLCIGVVLALGGQAWWESRSESATVQEYASNLLVEVEANMIGLEGIIGIHGRNIERCKVLLLFMADPDPADSSNLIRERIAEIIYFSDFRPSTAALDNLVAAGELGLLDSAELQLAISAYARAIDDQRMVETELANFMLGDFYPYLSDFVPLLDVDFIPVAPPESMPNSKFEFDSNTLLRSMRFENLIARRMGAEMDAISYSQRLIGEANELISLLEVAD
jgi:hypothetical protein